MFFALTATQRKHNAFRKYPTRRFRVPFMLFHVLPAKKRKETKNNISKVVYTNTVSSSTRLNLGTTCLL